MTQLKTLSVIYKTVKLIRICKGKIKGNSGKILDPMSSVRILL